MRLRWSERALLASGLTCWVAPWGEPVTWRGVRLTPGGVVHGLVVGEERPLAVLEGRLGVTGEAAVIDTAGLVGRGEGWGGGEGWLLRVGEEELLSATALVGLWGAFEVGVVVLQTSREEPERRRRLARRWLALVEALPPRPWVVLGVGVTGYLDPLLRVIRDRGVSLLKVESMSVDTGSMDAVT